MPLKATYEKLDDVPEAARDIYTERDGKFHLTVEGLVTKERLDQFRDTNLELKKQVEALTEKFGDIDPDRYRELNDKAEKERTKKLIDSGKVDEMVTERVNAAKAGFDKQFKALDDEKRKLNIQLEGLLIDNAVRDAAAKSGVRPGAVDDVLLRARQVFKVENGVATAYDGDKQLFGKTGDPMTVSEYISDKLSEAAPHLFEASQGGGARKAETSNTGSTGKINRDDSKGFLDNLADIAGGKKQVA